MKITTIALDLAKPVFQVHGVEGSSENLATTAWCREALGRGALDAVLFDLAWIGGLTEGRKVAALAEAFPSRATPIR